MHKWGALIRLSLPLDSFEVRRVSSRNQGRTVVSTLTPALALFLRLGLESLTPEFLWDCRAHVVLRW